MITTPTAELERRRRELLDELRPIECELRRRHDLEDDDLQAFLNDKQARDHDLP